MFGRFDQVAILTTKNVRYLSAPPGSVLNPRGIWTVAGAVGDDLLLTRHRIVVRIPARDVKLAYSYDLRSTFQQIDELCAPYIQKILRKK